MVTLTLNTPGKKKQQTTEELCKICTSWSLYSYLHTACPMYNCTRQFFDCTIKYCFRIQLLAYN